MIAAVWQVWSPSSWRSNRRGRLYRLLRYSVGPQFRSARRLFGAFFRRISKDDRRCIVSSGLFDAQWYLDHSPDAAGSSLDPLDHYLTIGWKSGRSPGPHFDAARYLEHSRDAAIADSEPLLHFLRYGLYEGRKAYEVGSSMLDKFESLGENCEFGAVQRRFGVEPLGLFRFAATSIDGLISALESRLNFALAPGAIELTRTLEGEYVVIIEQYGFQFHTFLAGNNVSLERVKDFEARRLALLSRKLIEDLEEASKIFVYKSQPTAPREKIDALVACLRSFGPNHLLWITTEEPGRPAGFVETLSDGLMRGHVDKFSLYENSFDLTLNIWEALCQNAYSLWLGYPPRARAS
jgi:hypothetical protein